jgi:hypothetical protein
LVGAIYRRSTNLSLGSGTKFPQFHHIPGRAYLSPGEPDSGCKGKIKGVKETKL